jgi:hypothetical protein
MWVTGMGSGLLDPASGVGGAYSAQDMRRRIALAMLMKKHAAPKTLGEGLFSIGSSFGDAIIAKELTQQAQADSAATDASISKMYGTPAPATTGPRAAVDGTEPTDERIATAPQPQVPLQAAAALTASRPPPQISPMAQQAALMPTEPSPAFFPSTPQTAYSAPPSQLALSQPPPPNANVLRNPLPAMANNAAVYDAMSPRPPPPGPGSDAGGAMNPAQGSQLASLMRPPQPAQPSPYAPTAALQSPNVTSDAPQNPLARNGVTEALMARNGAPTPQAGPQVAQATPPNVFPPVPPNVKPILPGGGFPQTAPQVAPAPQSPQVRAAPDEYVPRDKPMPEPPAKPTAGPIEQQYTRDYLVKDIDPRLKAAAQLRIEQERAQRGSVYENQLKNYEIKKQNWLKEQELETKYRMDLPQQRATTEKTVLEAERERRGLPKVSAEAETAQLRAEFEKRTGREREPTLKALELEKEVVSKAASMLRDTQIAREALDSRLVPSGTGASVREAAARIAAKIGSNDEKRIVEESEKYNKAMDRTISYGVMLFNGKDPRITEGDIAMAKGLQGDPSMQEASKRKILDIMQADMHSKIGNYEDLREHYLRGDPQHRMFKVDAPAIATPEVRKALIDNQNRPDVIAEFDRMHGPGAAKLEIARHKRRMERPDD